MVCAPRTLINRSSPTAPPSSQPPPPQDPPEADRRSNLRATLDYSYIGIFFGVSVAIGYFTGRWADDAWGTKPWGAMVGLLFGVATGFRELYRIAKKYERQNRDEQS